jgi:glycerol-3-phosphate dehydrogenase (NAD(P)+)
MGVKYRVGVIGGGSWATALVKILCDNETDKVINWWVRTEEKAIYLQEHGHNPDYISSVEFHHSFLTITSDLNDCISNSDVVILAVPSAFVHSTLSILSSSAFENTSVISAVKGLIPETGQILGEYFESNWNIKSNEIGVITGPCHAEEVALERLSYLTIASENKDLTNEISALLQCTYIKTTTTDDIYGTEYSAVLKNVYAIAAGICHGMGYGDNFLSVLVSNAIREIKRFIAVVHPIDRDIDDSAYLGDLMVTAYSQFSRNRTFGHMLGKGYSVRSAQLEMSMIAEGYYGTKSIYELNKKYEVHMPILDFVHSVIYKNKTPRSIVEPFLDLLD